MLSEVTELITRSGHVRSRHTDLTRPLPRLSNENRHDNIPRCQQARLSSHRSTISHFSDSKTDEATYIHKETERLGQFQSHEDRVLLL